MKRAIAAYRHGRALAKRVWRTVRTPAIPLEAEMIQPWLRAYACRTVIDVGANEGQFASWARAAFPEARIYSFEPLSDCFGTLCERFADDPRFEAFAVAVGDREGEAEIFRNEYSPSSSLLPIGDAHRDAFTYAARTTPVTIPIQTLDSTLGRRELEGPLLLKIDAQGYESKVLAGGAGVIARAQLLLLELSLEPLFAEEPLFDEVYRQVIDLGFALRGVLDQLRRPSDRKPLQLDALFERVQPITTPRPRRGSP